MMKLASTFSFWLLVNATITLSLLTTTMAHQPQEEGNHANLVRKLKGKSSKMSKSMKMNDCPCWGKEELEAATKDWHCFIEDYGNSQFFINLSEAEDPESGLPYSFHIHQEFGEDEDAEEIIFYCEVERERLPTTLIDYHVIDTTAEELSACEALVKDRCKELGLEMPTFTFMYTEEEEVDATRDERQNSAGGVHTHGRHINDKRQAGP
eukprot:scaffold134995_cov74-Attheya_sp.AAC.1